MGSGTYSYRYSKDWPKLSAGMSLSAVSAVANDTQERVYPFQRAEPPVVMFDRQGYFVGSWPKAIGNRSRNGLTTDTSNYSAQ